MKASWGHLEALIYLTEDENFYSSSSSSTALFAEVTLDAITIHSLAYNGFRLTIRAGRRDNAVNKVCFIGLSHFQVAVIPIIYIVTSNEFLHCSSFHIIPWRLFPRCILLSFWHVSHLQVGLYIKWIQVTSAPGDLFFKNRKRKSPCGIGK